MKRIVFMGTPEFAAYILKYMIVEGLNIVAVVTQPDKKVGRKQEIKFSEVKEVAIDNEIDVLQPINIMKEYDCITSYEPDIIVTAAYGQMIPMELIEFPKYKCINVHGSLLPKYRGGAPIHRAIKNGDKETGVTIMHMEKKMDSGDIISQESFAIKYEDTLLEVYDNMKKVGAKLLISTLPLIYDESINPQKQDADLVTYSPNVSREDEFLNFENSSLEIYNHVRAYNPFPNTCFKFNDKVFKVFKVIESEGIGTPGEILSSDKEGIEIACGINSIKLVEFQVPGKKRTTVDSYINGKNEFEKGKIIGG